MMTNSENIIYGGRNFGKTYTEMKRLVKENDKLKAEVEQLKQNIIDGANDTYSLQKLDHELLTKEIEQLKSELEQSVKLPCKMGDNLYRPVPRLYKDIAKMKVKGFKIDEYGFRFETTKGTEWNCSSIGKTIFLSREEAEQHLKGRVEE